MVGPYYYFAIARDDIYAAKGSPYRGYLLDIARTE
jgi:hypothetical protein